MKPGEAEVSAGAITPVAITLNGVPYRLDEGGSVSDLIARLGLPFERVAVEVDGSLVRKADYPSTRLAEGAKVEVVSFVGGG